MFVFLCCHQTVWLPIFMIGWKFRPMNGDAVPFWWACVDLLNHSCNVKAVCYLTGWWRCAEVFTADLRVESSQQVLFMTGLWEEGTKPVYFVCYIWAFPYLLSVTISFSFMHTELYVRLWSNTCSWHWFCTPDIFRNHLWNRLSPVFINCKERKQFEHKHHVLTSLLLSLITPEIKN